MIDDYFDPSVNPSAYDRLPGVRAACDTVFADLPETVRVAPGDNELALAYFRKT